MSDNINFSDSNYSYEDEEHKETMLSAVTIDDTTDVRVWSVPTGRSDKTVFLMIGNTTISMPEAALLSVTKATQIAAKKLLSID